MNSVATLPPEIYLARFLSRLDLKPKVWTDDGAGNLTFEEKDPADTIVGRVFPIIQYKLDNIAAVYRRTGDDEEPTYEGQAQLSISFEVSLRAPRYLSMTDPNDSSRAFVGLVDLSEALTRALDADVDNRIAEWIGPTEGFVRDIQSEARGQLKGLYERSFDIDIAIL